jgi:hypothetical protein
MLHIKLICKKKKLGAVFSGGAWQPKQLRKPVPRPVQKSRVSILETLLGLLIVE